MPNVNRFFTCLNIHCMLIFSLLTASAAFSASDLCEYINPFIGTVRGSGSTYPGAQCPFGMLSFSPHTEERNHGSGYDYTCDKIRGFGLVHISGVGCEAVCELPFMPVTGPLNDAPPKNRNFYSSTYRHETENASPGYYSVSLDRYNIGVELSATTRCGIAKYHYPQNDMAHLIFAPTASANGMRNGSIEIDSENQTIFGWVRGGGFCNSTTNDYVIYYVIKFDTPFINHGIWFGDLRQDGQTLKAGNDIASYVSFDCTQACTVIMKTGISYVSLDNAIENLSTEIPDWNFDTVRASARNQWNQALNKVRINGGTSEQKTMFYTSLYHSIMLPNIFDDCNGQYLGMDDMVYTVKPGHHNYVTFSGWDTYRTQAQLWALLYPQAASDFCQTFVDTSRQTEYKGGGGLPLWSMFNDETNIMAGYPAVPFAASAYAFGARDFDVKDLTEIMIDSGKNNRYWGRNNHMTWDSLEDYLKCGYYADDCGTYCTISQNIEYALADFSIARMCLVIGDNDNYNYYLSRSQSPFNLLHPTEKYLWARYKDGSWKENFDPKTGDGCQEGTSTQYTWGIAHNLGRLINEIGGSQAAEEKLDWLMSEVVDGYDYGNPHYLAGNEPCFGIVPVYNWTGSPWKAQKYMRQVMDIAFSNTPKGIPGDDDSGAMSAWYIFAALGLYPEIPGVGGFAVTGPLFPEITLDLGSGKQLTIIGQNAEAKAPYISEMSLNNNKIEQTWLTIEQLTQNQKNELKFTMSQTPDKNWGKNYTPPSFDTK